MSAIQPAPHIQNVDLSAPPPLAESAQQLLGFRLDPSVAQDLEALTFENDPRRRSWQLAEVIRKLDNKSTLELFRAAGKASLRLEPPGLRFLFGFLEVKRPGVEVLRQLETLSSLERVALRIVSGRWKEPEESQDADSSLAIIEVLQEASHVGVLELGLETLPNRPLGIQTLVAHIRSWFVEMRQLLETGNELAEPLMHYLTQLAMLEIALVEKRVSMLATTIDPYDVRGMGRLLPVLSRYDQDIEHMKSVVSRMVTYKPFHDRLLTMEHVLSSNELDKTIRGLYRARETVGLGHIVSATRGAPILDRRLAYLVSVAHQVGFLRARQLGAPAPADIHSTLLQVVLSNRGEDMIHMRMEDEVADALWPTVETWGMLRDGTNQFEMPYREERSGDFVDADGTPKFPDRPREHEEPKLSLAELVRSQIQNEIFILGILENGRATVLPGLVEVIAENTRSLRVLDKICRMKNLHSGAGNKRVPAMVLRNPSRIPITFLRRFINVRYVSKVDLRQMVRAKGTLRNEVTREIEQYLDSLKG